RLKWEAMEKNNSIRAAGANSSRRRRACRAIPACCGETRWRSRASMWGYYQKTLLCQQFID
ncbi:MAG: hypothetical protein KAI90_05615, partial [Desulfobulbaceae bacterium]|nr:hypothetical protein [Desulfobulbaceae bacterium]